MRYTSFVLRGLGALLLATTAVACAGEGVPDVGTGAGGTRSKRDAAAGLAGVAQHDPDDTLFGRRGTRDTRSDSGIPVNAYLWRASLDTVSFIPLASADPFGGVIITDWYVPQEAPAERMKVQVTILDRDLRADGVRVSVFKQVQPARAGGAWVDAQVDPRTSIDIENAILTRARQLRIAQQGR